MNYSDSDIMRAVGANAFSAGKAYQRQGRFIAFQWDGDSGITAQVQGSDRKPYRQSISIETIHRGRVLIEGGLFLPRCLQLQTRRGRPAAWIGCKAIDDNGHLDGCTRHHGPSSTVIDQPRCRLAQPPATGRRQEPGG